MVEISKYDKKVWDNYVSNLEKSILLPKNNSLVNTKRKDITIVLKNNKSFNHFKNFKKKNLKPNISLDLHGYTLYSAKLSLLKFISNCYEKNVRNTLIITGKGQNNNGALKEEVPKWLADKIFNNYIVSFSLAPRHLGGDGALLVRIKNKFKKI